MKTAPKNKKIRLMVVYHAGMMPAAQDIFKEFSGEDDILELLVLAPSKLKVDKIYAPSGELLLEGDMALSEKAIIRPVRFLQRGGVSPLAVVVNILKFKPTDLIVLNEGFSKDLFFVSIAGLFIKVATFWSISPKIYFYGFENLNKWKSYSWKQKIIAKIISKTVHFGAVCTGEAQKVLNDIGWYPVVSKIWWGVPLGGFEKNIDKNEIEDFKKNIGIDPDEKVVGYIGRFIPEKGIFDLLDAVKGVDQKVSLLFVGDGSEKESLQREASKIFDRKISFLPSQAFDKIPLVLKSMDVLVLPSKTTAEWKEQYGRVLIEAMASGVSVVGSDSGAIPEVIGDVGSVFREGDVAALQKAIMFELESQNQRKTASLKERSNNGSISAFVRNWIEFMHYE